MRGDIVIPDSVVTIGNNAFLNTGTGKVKLFIGSGLKTLSQDSFRNIRLTSVTVDEDNTSYYSSGNCLISYDGTLIKGCDTSVIPNDNNIKEIGMFAFESCAEITGVSIPDGVEEIEFYAFSDCENLETVNLGRKLKRISWYAFEGCAGLKEIVVYRMVDYIGQFAFYRCDALEKVYFCGDIPCMIFSSDCEWRTFPLGTVLYYPSGSDEWTSDENFDAVNGTYGGYTAVPWTPGYLEPLTIAQGFCGGDENADYISSSGCYDNISWELKDDCTLILSGSGVMKSYSYNNIPWDAFTQYIRRLEIGENITALSDIAFRNCGYLKGSLSISENLTGISNETFIDSQFTSITVDKDNPEYRAVKNCLIDSNGKIILGCSAEDIPDDESINTISSYAFYGCKKTEDVVIPANIKCIEGNAFSNINAPENVYFLSDKPLEKCHRYAFGSSAAADRMKIYYPAGSTAWENVLSGGGTAWTTYGSETFSAASWSKNKVQDVNRDGEANASDAVYLLWSVFYPDEYKIRFNYDCDFNSDGKVNSSDAVWLLWSILDFAE